MCVVRGEEEQRREWVELGDRPALASFIVWWTGGDGGEGDRVSGGFFCGVWKKR